MVFLHGAGIAFWAGALVPLGLSVRRQSADAGAFLHRFSRAILPVVAVLAMKASVFSVGRPGASPSLSVWSLSISSRPSGA